MARLVALWHGAMLEVRLDNAERVGALADEMQALVDEFALAHGRTACRWFRAWADAKRDASRDAHQRIRSAYEDNVRLGDAVRSSETLAYATEALLLAGDLDGAQAQFAEALQVADRLAERVYLPQLHLLEAAIARARGDVTAAGASVRRAIEEARAQEAPWLEFLAMIALCENEGAAADDRRALATLVDRLPEARDTPAFARARALLEPAKPH